MIDITDENLKQFRDHELYIQIHDIEQTREVLNYLVSKNFEFGHEQTTIESFIEQIKRGEYLQYNKIVYICYYMHSIMYGYFIENCKTDKIILDYFKLSEKFIYKKIDI